MEAEIIHAAGVCVDVRERISIIIHAASGKARIEMRAGALTEFDVIASRILNAVAIYKTLQERRSTTFWYLQRGCFS